MTAFADLLSMARLHKIVLRALIIFGGGLLAFCLAVAALFYFIASPSRDEVVRVVSPSGDLIATVVEINGGATTSYGYEVRISRVGFTFGGAEVASLYGAVRNDRAYGVNLRWVSDRELCVEYLAAEFSKVVPSRTHNPSVHVVLKPGVLDPSAPPGGMLYNLQKGHR